MTPRSPTRGRDAAPAPSELQREFIRLSQQVRSAQQRLHDWREMPASMQTQIQTRLLPAMEAMDEQLHRLLIQIDMLLTAPPKGLRLGAQRRALLREYLCDQCLALLAQREDDTLLAIHDRHNDVPLADIKRQAQAHERDLILELLDRRFGRGVLRPQPGESDEAFLMRAQQRLEEADALESERAAAAAQRRAARKAEKAAKQRATKQQAAAADAAHRDDRAAPQPGPSHPFPPETDAADAVADTHTAYASPEDRLRTLYRRLASALHPDRARDADTRAARTLTMQRLNAAWEARDLPALLALQAETLHDTADAALPDAQARDYIALLKAQLTQLQAENRHAAEQCTPPSIYASRGRPRDPAQLLQWLHADIQYLQMRSRRVEVIAHGLSDAKHRSRVLQMLVEMAGDHLIQRDLEDVFDEIEDAPW
jgi:hypothetical protein